eukprot:4868123-Amphidinium_carterae.1
MRTMRAGSSRLTTHAVLFAGSSWQSVASFPSSLRRAGSPKHLLRVLPAEVVAKSFKPIQGKSEAHD